MKITQTILLSILLFLFALLSIGAFATAVTAIGADKVVTLVAGVYFAYGVLLIASSIGDVWTQES